MPKQYFSIVILLLFLLQPVFTRAQTATDTIDRAHINGKLVEQLFLKELNQLRASKSLPVLQHDNILNKAANEQSAYCNRQDKLTHYQVGVPQKYDPKKRVQFAGGNHPIVGENALKTFLFQRYTESKTGNQVTIYTYTQLAHQLFVIWKNSPPHYKNMINPLYTNTGLSLSLQSNNTILYAVQVFGCVPYTPPHNGLHYTDTTFGIAEHDIARCKSYGDNDYLAQVFASYTLTLGDSIFQYYQDEKRIHEMIEAPKDGIAIDLVYKDQFSCDGPNHLHPSTVFDGYLLPPVYRDNLFKNDVYTNQELLSLVGVMPPNAPQNGLQLNTILIQNGTTCRYSFPVTIEDGILPDLIINPKWCETQGVIKKDEVTLEKEFRIPFKKNDKTADSLYFEKLARLVKVYDGAITRIEITAYSSVEGTEANNIELQSARATFIENFILQNLHQKTSIEKRAIENWNLFHEQIQLSSYKNIFGDSVNENVRSEVNTRMTDPIVENWLNEQRVASIRLHIHQAYDNDVSANFLPLVLYNSLEKGDSAQASIAYSRMIEAYQKGEIAKYFLTATEVPLQRKNLPLISNYLASLLVESDIFNYHDFNHAYYTYIDSARKLYSDFGPLAFNLAVYKTHLYFHGLTSNVDEFKKIETDLLRFKKDTSIDKELQNHLFYNYYLTGSLFYKKLRTFPDMFLCFEKVKPYLSLASLQQQEVFEVGKYFNYFFRFNETIELLEKYIPRYPGNEDLTYLYISTGAIYNLNINYHPEEFYRQLDKLATMNRPRLCEWFNQNYQLLRDESFKKKICMYCSLK